MGGLQYSHMAAVTAAEKKDEEIARLRKQVGDLYRQLNEAHIEIESLRNMIVDTRQ